jgi:hypothetical protein
MAYKRKARERLGQQIDLLNSTIWKCKVCILRTLFKK